MSTLRKRTMVVACALAAGWFMAPIFPTAVGLARAYFPWTAGTAIRSNGRMGAIALPRAVGYIAERDGVSRGLLVPVVSAALMLEHRYLRT
jgi:fucose permease